MEEAVRAKIAEEISYAEMNFQSMLSQIVHYCATQLARLLRSARGVRLNFEFVEIFEMLCLEMLKKPASSIELLTAEIALEPAATGVNYEEVFFQRILVHRFRALRTFDFDFLRRL